MKELVIDKLGDNQRLDKYLSKYLSSYSGRRITVHGFGTGEGSQYVYETGKIRDIQCSL